MAIPAYKIAQESLHGNKISLDTLSESLASYARGFIKEISDENPMSVAAEIGSIDIFQCLFNFKNSIPEDKKDKTALEKALIVAAANGYLKVVECLIQHGADVHARDDEALRAAVKNDHK
jgi:hypothetical protein